MAPPRAPIMTEPVDCAVVGRALIVYPVTGWPFGCTTRPAMEAPGFKTTSIGVAPSPALTAFDVLLVKPVFEIATS